MSTKLSRHGVDLEKAIWLAITEQCGDDLIYLRKFAVSDTLTANTKEDIWSYGGALSYLSSAETISVVSASANDDEGGTGATILSIAGLDNDYNFASEFLTLNGTTPVVTANEYLRIYRVRVVGAGSGEKNAGAITGTASTSSTVQFYIQPEFSITQMCHFTIPANYTAISLDTNVSIYRASGSGTRAGEVEVEARAPVGGGSFVQYRTNKYGLNNTGSGLVVLDPHLPPTTPEKIDLKYTIDATQNNTKCSIQFTMLLIKSGFTGNVSVP